MRVIVNIPSDLAAGAAGWRAKAVEIGGKSEAVLDEILKRITLADRGSMYDLLVKDNHLTHDWILYVNGIRIPADSSLETRLRDNTQIHILDNPHPGIAGKSRGH